MNPRNVYVNAYMAGLISMDQQNTPYNEVEIKGDLASLLQFAELTIRDREIDQHMEAMEKLMKERND
jgi:hypothetical protein